MVHLLTFKISFCSLSVQRWRSKWSKARGWPRGGQMPDSRATQNLLMSGLTRWANVPQWHGGWGGRRGAGRGAVGFDWCILKHAKENLANIQSFWPHAWSIAHVCRFTSPLSFGISDLPTFLTAGHVYSPAPGFILFHKQQVEIFNFSF